MCRICSVFLAAALVLSAACRGASPQSTAGGPRVYVSDETGGAIVVIDPDARKVVQKIDVGKRPRGIRISHDGTRLFVALSGSPIGGPGVDESKLPPADRTADGIGVVDLSSGTLVRKYQSGPDPESFSLSSDGRTLFASNEDSGELTAVDLESGAIRGKVKVGEEPEGVTTGPDGTMIFVTCEATNEVAVVNAATLAIAGRIPTGPRPRSIAFSRDGRVGFVTSENSASLTVFDVASHKATGTIDMPKAGGAGAIPPRPMGQQISPDGLQLFVTLGRARSIAVIDVDTQVVSRIIGDVGARPWGIGISADGRTLYTANGPSGDVSIVDAGRGQTVGRVAVGGSPWGIAVASGQ